ncbi:MAG: hypothetical protein QOE70_4424 [Chthoniobacter sp.]|jgi:hypothetical protein|nr:hypothetical protein [Chthoniobacter sp.]
MLLPRIALRALFLRVISALGILIFTGPAALAEEKIDFEKQILPILDNACFKCHSARSKKPKGDVRLDDVAAIRAKTRTDNLIFPRKPEKSLLVKVISLPAGDEDLMPPADERKALSAEEVALIRTWISEGADFGHWKSATPRALPVAVEQEVINAADVAATARRIDQLIEAGLVRAGHQPNPPIAEDLWCRRVYLDLVGRIPTCDELLAFTRSSDPQKSGKLINALLASKGHVSTMFNYWCDTLRARDQLADRVRGDFYLHYIKESIRTNQPYDRWVRELLSPEGGLTQSPAVGYYLRDLGNRFASVDNTATIFLGTQIGCAQCHDHPYDEWSRRAYHQFAAWTSAISTSRQDATPMARLSEGEIDTVREKFEKQIARRTSSQRRLAENSLYLSTLDQLTRKLMRQRQNPDFAVRNGPQADGHLPSDYRYPDGQPNEAIEPAVLFGQAPPASGRRPADVFAAWLTAPENPRFALTIANRMWARMLGAPFSGTLESVRAPEESANPELTRYLTRVMVAVNFDLRQFQRIVANTRTYARQSGTLATPGASYDFPGPLLRRMSAEQVWDSLMALAVPNLDGKVSFDLPEPAEESDGPTDASSVEEMVRTEVQEQAREKLKQMRRHTPPPKPAPYAASPEFTAAQLVRASELPHPAPESHFLRVFGQSNREVADGGWRSGTVPQTLVMLNSTLFDVLVQRGTPLATAMTRDHSDSGRLHAVYLSILGRMPTLDEMRMISSTFNGTGNTEAIAHTLLGTRQFLFIQ